MSINTNIVNYRQSLGVSNSRPRPSIDARKISSNTVFPMLQQSGAKPSHFIPTGTILAKNIYCETSLVAEKGSQTILMMKKFEKKLIGKRRLREDLEREMQVHVRLDHPNLIRFLHIFEDSEYIYLVCEYAPQGNFFSYLKEKKKLSEEEVFPVFLSCCLAFDQLTKNNISIRTVNLEKILRSGGQIKFSAFSFEEFLRTRDPEMTSQEGSLTDMKPKSEKVSASKAILIKLGNLLVELLTGRASIRRSSVAKLASADVSSQAYINKLDVSQECKSLLEQLINVECDEIKEISDILNTEWVITMLQQLKIDPKGIIPSQNVASRQSMASRGSVLSGTRNVPRASVFSERRDSNSNVLTDLKLSNEDNINPRSRSSIRQTSIRQNDWRRREVFNENSDISMSNSRFFDKRQLNSRENAQRISKIRTVEKSFMQKVVEVFGCSIR